MPSKSVFISDSEIGTLDQTRVDKFRRPEMVDINCEVYEHERAAEAISGGLSKICCGVASLRTEFLGFSCR